MRLSKRTSKLLTILFILYGCVCAGLFLFQRQIIFHPSPLPKNYRFNFASAPEEIYTRTGDDQNLHGLLFHADNPKGLIFYLHGNGGTVASWGEVTPLYTSLGYDVFMFDYRGYGKSDGRITTEQQLYDDAQVVYNMIKKRYPENRIIIIGYSLGTCLATKLAAENKPFQLILQAPYYSMNYMMRQRFPLIPTFILQFKLPTYQYLPKCKMPVTIFHGDADKTIPYQSSIKLSEYLEPTDKLICLRGQGHNDISYNPDYIKAIKILLNK